MAKIAFSKFALKANQDVKIIEFNGQSIEVKQYLPVNNKLELISNVINLSADENNFANPIKASIFAALEILYAYTNIQFTEKQKEDPAKLYDIIISTGFYDKITDAIPEEEYMDLFKGIENSIAAVYKYKNSAMGIFETITTDYSNLKLDASEIQSKIADPENLALLKDVLTKLG